MTLEKKRFENLTRSFGAWLFLLLLSSVLVQADVVPGRWNKIESLDVGTTILVRLKSSDRIEGRFLKLEPLNIQIEAAGSNARSYRRDDVERIEAGKLKSGSGKKGALIGLAAGGGAGAVFGGLLGDAFGGRAGDIAQGAAILGAVGGAIGAAIGYGVAKIPLDSELLYRAP
ncbi:MAG: hypothetical protein ACR2L2_05785 [Acidobacteriota bacterium]